MSQSTVSLRYSGSFSSLKSLWGEENNTENDEVGKEEGRRPPKVAFFTSSARYYQPASQPTRVYQQQLNQGDSSRVEIFLVLHDWQNETVEIVVEQFVLLLFEYLPLHS